MIQIKSHKQNELFDHWDFMSPKRRALLDQSWPGLFQKELICELSVGEVARFFTDGLERIEKNFHPI